MFGVLVSILLLALGPLLANFAKRDRSVFRFLDALIVVCIVSSCFIHILPETLSQLGLPAIFIIVGAAWLPHWAEGRIRDQHNTHSWLLALAMLALLIHTLFDGAGYWVAEEREGQLSLLLPLWLHRVPVALFLWIFVRDRYGLGWAVGCLAALGFATLLGYLMASAGQAEFSSTTTATVEALLIGSLCHLLLHNSELPSKEGRDRAAVALGTILGLAIVWFLPLQHIHLVDDHKVGNMALPDFNETFQKLFYESSGAILLGFLVAGLLSQFAGNKVHKYMTGSSSLGSAGRGLLFGLPLPICSCGVVPLYHTLLKRGAPPAAALSFLIATPELGFDAVLLSWPLLGPYMTAARVLAAVLVALIVGALLGPRFRNVEVSDSPDHLAEDESKSVAQKFVAGLRYASMDMVDHLGAWIILGLFAATLLEPMIDPEQIKKIAPWLQIVVLVALAAPGYICASAATPLAAIMLVRGLSPGAVLAFLIAGPATNTTTFGVLAKCHGRREAFETVAAIVGLSIGLGLLTNWFLPPSKISTFNIGHQHSALLKASGHLLALLLLFSLLRIGPRGFVEQIVGRHEHDHDHDHNHDHCHDHSHDHEHKHKASHCHSSHCHSEQSHNHMEPSPQ